MDTNNSQDLQAEVSITLETPVVPEVKALKAKKGKKMLKTVVAETSVAVVETPAVAVVETPAVAVVETPVTPVVIAPVKVKIDLVALVAPTGVTIEIKKCGAKVFNDKRKLWVKGSTLEFSDSTILTDSRINVLDKDAITKAHLGSMKAILKGIKDMADLQSTINAYFA